MRRFFHATMLNFAVLGLFLSFSGILATPTEKEAVAEPAEQNEMTAEEFDAIITEVQHDYQRKSKYGEITGPIPEVNHPKVASIIVHPKGTGLIVWEDTDGNKYETGYEVTKEGDIAFDEDPEPENVRSILAQRIQGIIEAEEAQ